MLSYFINVIVTACSEFSLFYMYYALQGRRSPMMKLLLLSVVPCIFAMSIVPLLIFLRDHLGVSMLLTGHLVNLSLNLLVLIAIGERNLKRTMFYTLFSYMLWVIFSLGIEGGLEFLASRWMQSLYFSYGLSVTSSLLLVFVMHIAIPRYDLCRVIDYLQRGTDTWTKIITLYLGFIFATTIMDTIRSREISYSVILFLTSLIIFAVLLAVLRSTFARIALEDKERMQETAIAQQNLYIQNLEEIHQNVRRVKHDYKNMITSLYLQSREGNLEEIEDAIGQMLQEFDMDIDKKMNLTNQLANVQVMELKGLLMNKITEINSRHINFHFEVLYPVEDLILPKMDVIRAVGILLDNAVEEVSGNDGDISLIILREKKLLTFVVENSLHHEITIAELYREGYTTKGAGRGIGLSSYRKLIDKYQNVSSQTMIQEDRFIQELRIGEAEE